MTASFPKRIWGEEGVKELEKIVRDQRDLSPEQAAAFCIDYYKGKSVHIYEKIHMMRVTLKRRGYKRTIGRVGRNSDWRHRQLSDCRWYASITRGQIWCHICGSKEKIHIHHIMPLSWGTPNINREHNLVYLCKSCHLKIHKKIRARLRQFLLPHIDEIYAFCIDILDNEECFESKLEN